MINLNSISLQFGHKIIFNNLSWHIKRGQKISLIGRNGVGKTTLFRVLTGELEIDKGDIAKMGGIKVAYLPQEHVKFGNKTVFEEITEGNEEFDQLKKKVETLEKKIHKDSGYLDEYSKTVTQFELLGGYNRDNEAKKILSGIGFEESDFDRSIDQFSGGWKMRVYLGKLLLNKPDLLLLDEPTNHLDLPALVWLEKYLKNFKGSVILISHDKKFINEITDSVVELNSNGVDIYSGNYQFYLKNREERFNLLYKEYKKQEEEIESLKRFVERFKAKASKATQAQSKAKKLEKMLQNKITLPHRVDNIKFSLPEAERSGRSVITLKDVTKKYDQNTIFYNTNFDVERGEVIAIVGKNGIGKTTLLKMIANKTDYSGDLEIGYNVKYSYFGQHQIDELNVENTIFQEVRSIAEGENDQQLRTILGSFMFSGEDIKQKILTLSGGEKSRVALVKMLLKKGNLLLLDEPTNHLDIDSKNILLDGLKRYKGTIIFVSHDRDFIEQLANVIVTIEGKKLIKYVGDYNYYLSKTEEQSEQTDHKKIKIKTDSIKSDKVKKRVEAERRQERYKILKPLEKKFEKIEGSIDSHEKEKERLTNIISDPEFYKKNSSSKIEEINKELSQIDRELESLNESWEELYLEIEEIKERFK